MFKSASEGRKEIRDDPYSRLNRSWRSSSEPEVSPDHPGSSVMKQVEGAYSISGGRQAVVAQGSISELVSERSWTWRLPISRLVNFLCRSSSSSFPSYIHCGTYDRVPCRIS